MGNKLQHERQNNEAFRRKDLDDFGVGKDFLNRTQ